ncbi:MAG: ATP-binding protein [Candidatus Anstonellales archaeon]
MGQLAIQKLNNVIMARRNILVRPPEPPMELVFENPLDSIYVGRTKIFHVPFYWSPKNVANPHIAIVGISGSGKSYFIKTFLVRSSFVWNTNAVIIDWAGEYKDWVRQAGGKVISLGKGSYINLLDLGGMKPYDRIKQVMRSMELLTDIGAYPEQKRLTEVAIEKAYLEAKFRMDSREQKDELGRPLKPPTLKDVVRILQDQASLGTYEFPAELENAIYRLKQFTRPGEDFFAQPSTVTLDEIVSSGIVSVDLSGLPDENTRALGALTILQFLKERMRLEGWKTKKSVKPRLIVVVDEAWKISKDENSDVVMIVREGRKYAFSIIVASQNPTDISEAIFSNVGTTFILKVKFEKFLDYLQGTLNFSNAMRAEIAKFGVGQAAVNMSFTTPTPYPPTFLLERIVGEEPSKDLFLDFPEDLVKEGEFMGGTVSFEKETFRRRLRQFGLDEEKIEEISGAFEKKNRHMDIVYFVIMLERFNINRDNIVSFLKEIGIDDSTIINIFTKVDYKKMDLVDKDVMQIVLEED